VSPAVSHSDITAAVERAAENAGDLRCRPDGLRIAFRSTEFGRFEVRGFGSHSVVDRVLRRSSHSPSSSERAADPLRSDLWSDLREIDSAASVVPRGVVVGLSDVVDPRESPLKRSAKREFGQRERRGKRKTAEDGGDEDATRRLLRLQTEWPSRLTADCSLFDDEKTAALRTEMEDDAKVNAKRRRRILSGLTFSRHPNCSSSSSSAATPSEAADGGRDGERVVPFLLLHCRESYGLSGWDVVVRRRRRFARCSLRRLLRTAEW
jgi:hypothetical protein